MRSVLCAIVVACVMCATTRCYATKTDDEIRRGLFRVAGEKQHLQQELDACRRDKEYLYSVIDHLAALSPVFTESSSGTSSPSIIGGRFFI
jgi:hypothetical protein